MTVVRKMFRRRFCSILCIMSDLRAVDLERLHGAELRQIGELKELVAGGKSLEANQLAKIKGEEGVKEELAVLQAELQKAQAGAGLAKNSQDEGKWR